MDMDSPVVLMKAIKNENELKGLRDSHRRDGAAMAKFFSKLEKLLSNGQTITEVEIDELATNCRKESQMFRDLSFDTIAGVNTNGAIMHYR